MRSAVSNDSSIQVTEGGPKTTALVKEFLKLAIERDRAWLKEDARNLHAILGNKIPVLPPETIHVDYQVVPVMVMDGYGLDCSGCDVRGEKSFAIRDKENIDKQIGALRQFYGPNLYYLNSVLLGQNNALAAGEPTIEYAASQAFRAFWPDRRRAFRAFWPDNPYFKDHPTSLFMFSTVDTFLEAPDSMFHMLDKLPFGKVHINLGWEAVTNENLVAFGKGQRGEQVIESMKRARQIHDQFPKVQVSGNFVLGDIMNAEHIPSIIEALSSTGFNGEIYLSPLHGQSNLDRVTEDIHTLRQHFPHSPSFYLYTMQRL